MARNSIKKSFPVEFTRIPNPNQVRNLKKSLTTSETKTYGVKNNGDLMRFANIRKVYHI